ncbi:hypothetical protein P692DRAFT_20819779 [Suillus brevipes Sb2]|nr:hypothetical protein P692DRAFT_20819779 [Suillus brevipes Sb2]
MVKGLPRELLLEVFGPTACFPCPLGAFGHDSLGTNWAPILFQDTKPEKALKDFQQGCGLISFRIFRFNLDIHLERSFLPGAHFAAAHFLFFPASLWHATLLIGFGANQTVSVVHANGACLYGGLAFLLRLHVDRLLGAFFILMYLEFSEYTSKTASFVIVGLKPFLASPDNISLHVSPEQNLSQTAGKNNSMLGLTVAVLYDVDSRCPEDLRLQKHRMKGHNCSQQFDLFAHGTNINASRFPP